MTTTTRARLGDVVLPDFGMPAMEPLLPPSIFADRLERLRARMEARSYDRLVVWADREHSASLAFLTGFDPRFEEAVLIVGSTGDPALLVGNECYGAAEVALLPVRRVLFQDLSLPNQPRDASPPLPAILGAEGITAGTRVGVVGWKTYASRQTIEAPAFLVDELRAATGPTGREAVVRLLTRLGPRGGPDSAADADQSDRAVSIVPHQPAHFRLGSSSASGSGGAAEPARLLALALSPGNRPIERGDPLTTAFGIWDRIQARRRFMAERLGIDLHPDVLPFSNLAAHLTPFLLRPDRAMTM